ncbi:hypothetical protein IMZ48_18100 [Candidatus Bathyarchaeota archaeon]|nr:hypothetical protein [Candidatus Bathyarchaeota archaeon]
MPLQPSLTGSDGPRPSRGLCNPSPSLSFHLQLLLDHIFGLHDPVAIVPQPDYCSSTVYQKLKGLRNSSSSFHSEEYVSSLFPPSTYLTYPAERIDDLEKADQKAAKAKAAR